jgi:hypothetical protein
MTVLPACAGERWPRRPICGCGEDEQVFLDAPTLGDGEPVEGWSRPYPGGPPVDQDVHVVKTVDGRGDRDVAQSPVVLQPGQLDWDCG